MPLGKNSSWEFVTSMHYLSIDGNLSLANKTHVWHDTQLRNCLNRTCKRFFKELINFSSKRFLIKVHSFSKSTASSFSLKISWHYHQLSPENVLFSSYLYWGAKTGTVFTSIVIISTYLQSIIQDHAAKVITSMGKSYNII